MDLLGETPRLDLGGESWRIYSRHEAHTPQFIGACAKVENSSITEGCEIEGTVINSVLGAGVKVAAGATVRDSVIMADVTIDEGAVVSYSIVDEGCRIGKNARVGHDRADGVEITVLAMKTTVCDGECVKD